MNFSIQKNPYFYFKYLTNMKWLKLTAYSFCLATILFAMVSCERNAEENKVLIYERKEIPMTGAQEVPAVPTTGLGSMDVNYSKETRILTYTVRWSGLTDSVSLMHIHGLAPAGFNAGIVQNIVHTSNSIFPQKTSGKYTFSKTGSISGTLLVDGVFVKEADLLNGMYYMNIHTPVYPGGEIRGQIVFQ